MCPTCIPLVRYQAVFGEQLVSTFLTIAKSYAALMDPRPDLAVPARSIKLPFMWWW
jgi:hypothetical protein